ncbi:MAG: hypoxanthine phosphoribosyltransferase [Rickettsiales bacterium]|nr:hypoxanthine phosphoribosyltransferase [Rickettsiales bacterium]
MDEHSIPVMFTEEEISDRIEELAHLIAKEMPGDLMIVGLLRGSFMFIADLIRALYKVGVHPQIDFMTLSSYEGTESRKEVQINRDINEDVTDKQVLVVDDILETGRTLRYALDLLNERGAGKIKTCMLLEKPGKRDVLASADFVGFTVPDKFVVGYGLDYDNHYRELPYIGYLEIH